MMNRRRRFLSGAVVRECKVKMQTVCISPHWLSLRLHLLLLLPRLFQRLLLPHRDGLLFRMPSNLGSLGHRAGGRQIAHPPPLPCPLSSATPHTPRAGSPGTASRTQSFHWSPPWTYVSEIQVRVSPATSSAPAGQSLPWNSCWPAVSSRGGWPGRRTSRSDRPGPAGSSHRPRRTGSCRW
jgi:hypothetical protein